jgi:serine/threonine protein kinase
MPGRPTRLGGFDVIAKIAGGGLSTIYLARAAGAAGAVPVALKVIRDDLRADDEVVGMFLDEASLLAKLRHPNIVRTVAVNVAEGQRFIAMELLLGVTLASVHEECVARGVRLAPEIVAWIGARVAGALAYAHAMPGDDGKPHVVIHRDVNPRNVLITFEGDVKLFDFGLAKTDSTRNARTSPGIVKGTLPYVSPEQIMQLPLDGRSDIFGLGTTIWELLTAKRLFRRETDAETVRAVQRGPIPDPRTVAPEVPELLAQIVKQTLERNRDNRYANAAELARDLDTFVKARGMDDARARVSKLVLTLFPDEHRRQRGWLKPLVSPVMTPTPAVPLTKKKS